MTDVIQLLPENVANQIAAGEVVQRPASVVKELLENAIDAGATQIKLLIRDSGKSLISVIDNGCGMSETDARMSFERHATSKIRTAQDLFAIKTMGFRGEALASIAAVAQVELRTRRAIDELGVQIVIDNSTVKEQTACQCPVGTQIIVKNLFFSVPARRNFLKGDAVEMRHIIDEFQRVALAHPDIFFSLQQGDQELFHLPAGNLRQRVVKMFGDPINKKLVPVQEETEALRITGFVGKPDYSKKTRGEQFFFVNQRFIKSAYLNHAVVGAYDELIPSEHYPLYVLFLDIDPGHIDINVHPTKQEIKFDDEKLVYNILKVSVRHALGSHSLTPTLDFEQEPAFQLQNTPRPVPASGHTVGQAGQAAAAARGGHATESTADAQRHADNLRNWRRLYEGLELTRPDGEEQEGEPIVNVEQWLSQMSGANRTNDENEASVQPVLETNSRPGDVEILALDDAEGSFSKTHKEPYQLHGQYIVSQIKSGLMLVDQQYAGERILYERYLNALQNSPIATQKALFPRTLELPAAEAEQLRAILDEVRRLGFDVEPFGGNTFIIHGRPADLPDNFDEAALLERMIGQFRDDLNLHSGIRETLARTMARHSTLRRGQILNGVEMQNLIDQLFACEMPFKSPGGRSCFITIELDELAKRFSA